MKFGVVVFPGSNCDYDAFHVIKEVLKEDVEFIWHAEKDLSEFDAVILPGGFSYGDYLRCGALASLSSVMDEVKKMAEEGKLVIGICNGFQVLTESKLLPGALMQNKNLKFICKDVNLKVVNNNTNFTKEYSENEIIKMPIAHHEGNYYADEDTLKELQENNQIVFKYVDESGEATEEGNPNGSLLNIAGIVNKKGNVLGMMPHPERNSESILGSEYGKKLFVSMINAIRNK